ncbi:MAG TPA: hypothetical protein VLM76_15465 [Patescibacteria group bacterium]|nr:hypothetical protein [Patescibacteria group bacterium]
MARPLIARFGVSVAGAALVLSLGAGAALGGETTGNGKSLKVDGTLTGLHSRSLCAYSGLNDEISQQEPGRTQSYGQLVRYGLKESVDSIGGSPGQACNPNIGFPE